MAKHSATRAQPSGRRDFLNYVIGAAMTVWAGLASVTFLRVVTPPARRLDGTTELDWLGVGSISEFNETPRAVAYGDETVYVYSLNGSLAAYSATCPHVRCVVKWLPDRGVYRCPCHASAFDKAGKKLYGPSARGLWAQRVRVQGGRVLLGGGTPPG